MNMLTVERIYQITLEITCHGVDYDNEPHEHLVTITLTSKELKNKKRFLSLFGDTHHPNIGNDDIFDYIKQNFNPDDKTTARIFDDRNAMTDFLRKKIMETIEQKETDLLQCNFICFLDKTIKKKKSHSLQSQS